MTPAPEPAELPSYAGPAARRSFRRIKLALFLSSMAACLFVTLIGVVCTRILMLAMGITGAATNYSMLSGGGFLGGMSGALPQAPDPPGHPHATGHASTIPAYATPELYHWLLSHKKRDQ